MEARSERKEHRLTSAGSLPTSYFVLPPLSTRRISSEASTLYILVYTSNFNFAGKIFKRMKNLPSKMRRALFWKFCTIRRTTKQIGTLILLIRQLTLVHRSNVIQKVKRILNLNLNFNKIYLFFIFSFLIN